MFVVECRVGSGKGIKNMLPAGNCRRRAEKAECFPRVARSPTAAAEYPNELTKHESSPVFVVTTSSPLAAPRR